MQVCSTLIAQIHLTSLISLKLADLVRFLCIISGCRYRRYVVNKVVSIAVGIDLEYAANKDRAKYRGLRQAAVYN